MNKRKTILIAIIAVLAVILLVFLWLFLRKEKPQVNLNANVPEGAAPMSIDQLPPASAERLAQEKNFPLGLKELSFSFAERYGSYSSDEPLKNLEDLKPLMTEKMVSASQNVRQSPGFGLRGYEGYDSWALSSNLQDYSADKATVLVQLQRAYYLGEAEPETYNQGLLLKAVKVSGEWRIDEATWQ